VTSDRKKDEFIPYLDEFLFDGQFTGLIEAEMIIRHYLDIMERRKVKPVLAGTGSDKFFCTLRPLEWDSEQLGRRVVRVDYISTNCHRPEQFCLFDSILAGFELAYLRLSQRHPLASLIQNDSRGFRAYADKIMLRLSIDPDLDSTDVPHVRGYNELEIPEKEAQLARIAGESFSINRFSRDKHFPTDFNDRVYRSWVSRCLNGDQNVLCSIRRNRVQGFIVVSDTIGTPLERFACGFVELVAVDRSAKRRSVGTELLQKAAATLLEKNIQILHANTDSQNDEAIRFFKAAGFKQFNSIREYHWWRA